MTKVTVGPVQDRAVDLSVVVPVYNEEAVLNALFDRLYPVLDGLGSSYEVVFVDDGSRDRSPLLLRQQHQRRGDVTRVLLLRRNVGQHPAILAGFAESVGRRVLTLDADLQNPPEEIPRLMAAMDQGHDYVGSIRRHRQDPKWRGIASTAMNRLRERITGISMTDQGCMLRAYDREIVEAVLSSQEVGTFIPALAYLYAANPTEITVGHEERAAGVSKYPLYKLINLNFDLITGFSLAPLQMLSLMGFAISAASFLLVLLLAVRRLIIGPEAEGLFTMFGILFFLAGVILFGIGLLGEYIGRIYAQSIGRPLYLIRTQLRPAFDPAGPSSSPPPLGEGPGERDA